MLKLMLVTNKGNQEEGRYLDFVLNCVQLGVNSVQLREKNLAPSELMSFGRRLLNLLAPFKVPLIMNDSVQLAQELDAQGVHLGQSDGDIIKARAILGSKKIIGLTVNSLKEVEISNSLPINYIGVGPIFYTANKEGVAWGCDQLKEAVKIAKFPVVAIGGINEHNIQEVMIASPQGVACIGALHEAKDLKNTILKLRNSIDHATYN